ncbi:hypothetical protein PAAG_11279 [Paracoccidioides lutzii Pb01]|uniref:Uncharacterized protein n=1 Tax=Paracoccidioides lutzii (strain ATCC MYA-826 / Pb01) TaxID=502779 RepID=A0A0A2VLZ9_PARBA|nr:hypothetical protein PAAG_11279 [Paracoccidioides lutzii Pb01]KGQ01889.1 hypothetical protein PAAG_11279 [Paracoccidioides lutzii Pb01]
MAIPRKASTEAQLVWILLWSTDVKEREVSRGLFPVIFARENGHESKRMVNGPRNAGALACRSARPSAKRNQHGTAGSSVQAHVQAQVQAPAPTQALERSEAMRRQHRHRRRSVARQ